MADLDESIVQRYAQHLLAKAGSVVRNWTIGGVLFGATLGAIPAFLQHSFIAHGAAGKFAVVLGALAGGIAGRTAGEKRALDLRFQAQMSLRQLEVEHRLVAPVPPAPVSLAQRPVSVPVAAPAPVAVAPPARAPRAATRRTHAARPALPLRPAPPAIRRRCRRPAPLPLSRAPA